MIITLSTVSVVSVPNDVTFACAAVCNVPVKSPLILPVTLPVKAPTNPPLEVTIPAAAILPLVNTVAPVLTDNAVPS